MTRGNIPAKEKLRSSTTLDILKVLQVQLGHFQMDHSRYSRLRSKNRFKMTQMLQLTMRRNPNACFIHTNRPVKDTDLKKAVYD